MLLRLVSVTKSYPRRRASKVALDCVSLEVARGEMVGVFGPSGTGKTALLRVASGSELPNTGVIYYEGQRLDRLPPAELQRIRRRELSCVWAGEPAQQGMSVLEHVTLPLLLDGRDHRAAKRLACETLLACEAEGCLEMEVQELSEGERVRVDIARALVSEPRLLLADSLFSRLSFPEQKTVIALLRTFAHDGKMGVLVTSLDAHTLQGADRVMYLREGKLLDVSAGGVGDPGKLVRLPTARPRRAAADA